MLTKSSFRTDIQALRGVAVLFVLFYHSGLGLLDGGFLGVDMFFVISGYLITGIITRAIDKGDFTFAYFYTRRARRLLPAAYTVLAVTTTGAGLLLTTTQYHTFFNNLVGSVFFSANISLWIQTGYFAPEAGFEPLLHLWSLAIEEQYYLFLPLILMLLPRRARLPLIAIATTASFAAGLYLAFHKPGVAFFLLPSRAWELGIGSLVALVAAGQGLRNAARRFVVPAVAAIAFVPIWTLPGPTPGLGALIICLATAIVILAASERAERIAALRPLARVGDFSYSLYLVHWPLFALSRATRLSVDLPVAQSIGLIVASLGLALLLYTVVEEPWRRSQLDGRRLLAVGLAASLAVLLLGLVLGITKPNALTRSGQQAPVEGLAIAGCFGEDQLAFKGGCTQSSTPDVLLWGDSYSAHLVPGLVATSRHLFAQASKGRCSPLLDYAQIADPNEYEFAKGCILYGHSVIDYIRRTPSLKVVILSGQFFRTLEGGAARGLRGLDDGSFGPAPLGINPTVAAQRATVATLRKLGLRVVIVFMPPSSNFNLGNCWERMTEGLPIFGPHRGCRLATNDPARAEQAFDALLAGFSDGGTVPVIRPDRALCNARECQIAEGGRPIFRDTGHFTTHGSLIVGRRLDLGEQAWRIAR